MQSLKTASHAVGFPAKYFTASMAALHVYWLSPSHAVVHALPSSAMTCGTHSLHAARAFAIVTAPPAAGRAFVSAHSRALWMHWFTCSGSSGATKGCPAHGPPV